MSKGVITADLKLSGKTPSDKDILTNWVKGFIKMSKQSLTRKVGHGSNEHDFVGLLLIILRKSSQETIEKEDRQEGEY